MRGGRWAPAPHPQCPLSSLPIDRYNRTGHSHLTSLESSDYSSVLVSPVLVASAVIGMVVAISCVTIIVGSLRRDSQGGSQQSRRRRREFEDSQGERLSIPGPALLSNGDCKPGGIKEVAALPWEGGWSEKASSQAWVVW